MKTTKVLVTNKLGLHARPSAQLSQVATSFKCEVWLTRNERRINAKSIMGVMMLAASQGTELLLEVDGVDEDLALEKLTDLFAGGFGESTESADAGS
ncbi:MAG: HPr family phosphocarrier protein [Burkholderiaceae bacterium]